MFNDNDGGWYLSHGAVQTLAGNPSDEVGSGTVDDDIGFAGQQGSVMTHNLYGMSILDNMQIMYGYDCKFSIYCTMLERRVVEIVGLWLACGSVVY